MPWADKWFDGSPKMLIFWTTFTSFGEILLFLPLPNFDTLIPKVSVPIVIFRTGMLILNITHHIPFVHHFPPFTVHIGYIILPYGFRFQRCMKIHDIIPTIYECLKACVDTIALIKVERFQQMIQITYEVIINKNFERTVPNHTGFLVRGEELCGNTNKIVPVTKPAV